jgi:hypothetical protein
MNIAGSKQSSALLSASGWFLAWLLFDPEEGSNMFHRNTEDKYIQNC